MMIEIDRMRALEANSAWRGVSRKLLMENAGAQLVKELLERKQPNRVNIFAGTGNNGGDGLVAARHMVNRGVKIGLVLLGRPRDIISQSAQENWQALTQMEDEIDFHIVRDSKEVSSLSNLEADVDVDAMLGTGISGRLREPIASAVEMINNRETYTAAVDVPTGLNPETGEIFENAVESDLTVTFHDSKPGLEKAEEKHVGDLNVADIGVPKAAEKRTGPGDVQMAISPRRLNSHKGQNGRVLVVGGGSRYVGAPALAGMAALKSGADLATIAISSKSTGIINSFSPDLITLDLPGEDLKAEAVSKIEAELRNSTALIVGPGLGMEDVTKEAVMKLMKVLSDDYSNLPVLLDADGLKIVSEKPDLLEDTNCLLTPHSGEFELLSGSDLPESDKERRDKLARVARELNIPILLKAHNDICASPDGRVVLNDTGNPGMTVGGTGDVLAGITGAFLSQGSEPFRAAAAGSFVCGLAGDLCSQEKGYEFTASDVKDSIPNAISNSKEYW